MENNSLKTFTCSWHGDYIPEMTKIMRKFRNECQPIINKYMNIFAKENLEYCSINGALYDVFGDMLLDARLQITQDLCQN